MQPVLTAQQSREQDSLSTVHPAVLLDRAGLAVSLAAVRLGAAYGRRVAVLAGPGNNGGDGYIAANYLQRRGVAVDLYPLLDPKTDEARQARDVAVGSGAIVREWSDIRSADLVIDALFGGAFRGELPDLDVWRTVAAIVAVDVPSGLSATTGQTVEGVMAADATITFHGPKVGHLIGAGPDLIGTLKVVDIGLPDVAPELWLCEESDAHVPVRARDAHKWSAGSVLVVGGSHGLDGAATLAARAALRAGAGAVMIGCPPSVEEKVRAPEIMTRAIGDGPSFAGSDVAESLALADRFDVVVLGPGLGPDVSGFVRPFLDQHAGAVLVDADALNALDGVAELKRSGETVITPHAGEFRRLVGEAATYQRAAGFAVDSGATVLLKGGPTFVMSLDDRWVITSGGPELATIGTGDVLAGMIAAFWAAGLDGPTAARSAAYWHGRAAANLNRSRVVTADLLVDHVGSLAAR